MSLQYNAPLDGSKSTIDAHSNSDQMMNFMWIRKAITTAQKEQYFTALSSTINMPKNMGKKIKVYEYIPVLDDRNVNDEGIDAAGVTTVNGNLYGSSRDIGKVKGKLPLLGENGGRVNRVGFTRIEREGEIYEYGTFYEFTQASLDFDSDPELKEHLATELVNMASQISEVLVQMDLLAGAGTVIYPGIAAADNEVTGEGATKTVVDYDTLVRLEQALNDNRTPKQTKVITGSRLVDTAVIGAARIMYIGHELVPLLKKIADPFGNAAFIPVQKYSDAGTVLRGEIGMITAGDFRVVVVPEMLNWSGAGAAATGANPGYRTEAGKYNVYPMLVVGDDSFVTIGFQTSGNSAKLNIMTKMPGMATADRADPYGKKGFSSISWYYGSLIKRPERLAVIKTVAPR